MRVTRDDRLRRALLAWAPSVDRPLPWRGQRDPYRVLVSEVMLHQTQAARCIAPYESFLQRFPTAAALADAPTADVIRQWGNLGYPRRALWLQRAARAVIERGAFPATVDQLRELPGVGPYTARAVAAYAFGVRVSGAEANVRRIITRLDGLAPDTDVQRRADDLVGMSPAGTWNQALMDLGALHCTPRTPRCAGCPLAGECAWVSGVRPEPRHGRAPAKRFESTARYARGRVMEAVRSAAEPLSASALEQVTGLDRARVDDALRGLADDGLVRWSGARASL